MSIDFSSQRLSYEKGELYEDNLPNAPYPLLYQWFDVAVSEQIGEAYAFTLATCGADNRPSARTLLMRQIVSLEHEGVGMIFYSNYDSAKGQDLLDNPYAEALFFWEKLERQIRISGRVEKLPIAQSQAYFASRPRSSQLAAWVSTPQSGVVANREQMDNRFFELQAYYDTQDIPKPDFWGGYQLNADRVEFWQGRANRMHDRIVYEKAADSWKKVRLLP
ncbi:MAG: pyridoxamine 5'-phosphate oxidase [Moraxella sp.]|nr:pyridoxamine 5'-phosphate oxidase [Moraxella sp.]